MNSLYPNCGRSFLFNILAHTTSRRDRFPYRLFWDRFYARTRSWTMPVTTVIHGRPVIIDFNDCYPIFSRLFPALNNPLIELVNQAFLALARPVRFVDIGASVGDTVLLVEANCPRMVSQYICVEGNVEFFAFLNTIWPPYHIADDSYISSPVSSARSVRSCTPTVEVPALKGRGL